MYHFGTNRIMPTAYVLSVAGGVPVFEFIYGSISEFLDDMVLIFVGPPTVGKN